MPDALEQRSFENQEERMRQYQVELEIYVVRMSLCSPL